MAARRGATLSFVPKGLTCPNTAITNVGNIDEFNDLSNAFSVELHPEDLRHRLAMAHALATAIGDAHPDDALQLMAAALTDLSPAGQRPDFFLSAEEDAAWWIAFETPEVLSAILKAVLANLGNRAMHRDTRKRLFLNLWRSFAPDDRSRFISFATGKSDAH